MTDWVAELKRLRAAAVPAVLVTVAGVRGSAPREVGAKMIVTAHAASGTIGGGELEYQCTQLAVRLLGDPAGERGFLRRFPLGSNCGQCCGGVVDVLFERMAAAGGWFEQLLAHWEERRPVVLVTTLDGGGRPHRQLVSADDRQGEASAAIRARARQLLARPAAAERIDTPGRGAPFLLIDAVADSGFDIAVFGAGHVGSAVVQVLAGLDCTLYWIDSRRDIFPARVPPQVRCVATADPAAQVAALPRRAFCLVMTHSHALDQAICARILARGDFACCGLIGSAAKRRRFVQRLRRQGLSATQVERLTCPIGIAGIAGKEPAAIAIAAAADILRRRERQLAAAGGAAAGVHSLHRRQ